MTLIFEDTLVEARLWEKQMSEDSLDILYQIHGELPVLQSLKRVAMQASSRQRKKPVGFSFMPGCSDCLAPVTVSF